MPLCPGEGHEPSGVLMQKWFCLYGYAGVVEAIASRRQVVAAVVFAAACDTT